MVYRSPYIKTILIIFLLFLRSWPLARPTIGISSRGQGKNRIFQVVIKSAASAASLDLQGSQRTTARHAEGGAG